MEKEPRYKEPRDVYNIRAINSILYKYVKEHGSFFQGTLEDLAKLMKVERKTIYNWRKKGYFDIGKARMKANGIRGFNIDFILSELLYFEVGY